ncbi:MAG TPA: NOB1 family endonuclease [Methanomassiliicoccales archaeon]|nr:NOB1 family endonuclease [Methanomassiliicoccales archaeon]
MDYVLDTSALFSMQDLPSDARCFTTPGVLRELEKYGDRRAELWGDMLTVSEPTAESLRKVREASSRTGDSTRLSPTDIEVLALALELGAQVLSDDYSLQNLAAYLGVPFRPIGLKGIKDVRRWRWRCVGCGRVFEKEMRECPVCGSRLKSTLSRKD